MASQNFFEKSCGEGPTETSNGYTNLSGLATDPMAGQSQSASNSWTPKEGPLTTGAPGTTSAESVLNPCVAEPVHTPFSESSSSPAPHVQD